jgi:hypothetical protein
MTVPTIPFSPSGVPWKEQKYWYTPGVVNLRSTHSPTFTSARPLTASVDHDLSTARALWMIPPQFLKCTWPPTGTRICRGEKVLSAMVTKELPERSTWRQPSSASTGRNAADARVITCLPCDRRAPSGAPSSYRPRRGVSSYRIARSISEAVVGSALVRIS